MTRSSHGSPIHSALTLAMANPETLGISPNMLLVVLILLLLFLLQDILQPLLFLLALLLALLPSLHKS